MTFNTTQPLYIGKLTDPNFGFEFEGSIDDVRIYDRVLDASEIDGADMPTDSLAGWWKLDELTKADCKKGGWADFGFKNQGQCIRFVNTGRDSR